MGLKVERMRGGTVVVCPEGVGVVGKLAHGVPPEDAVDLIHAPGQILTGDHLGDHKPNLRFIYVLISCYWDGDLRTSVWSVAMYATQLPANSERGNCLIEGRVRQFSAEELEGLELVGHITNKANRRPNGYHG